MNVKKVDENIPLYLMVLILWLEENNQGLKPNLNNAILTQHGLRWILPYFPLSHENSENSCAQCVLMWNTRGKYIQKFMFYVRVRASSILPVEIFSSTISISTRRSSNGCLRYIRRIIITKTVYFCWFSSMPVTL